MGIPNRAEDFDAGHGDKSCPCRPTFVLVPVGNDDDDHDFSGGANALLVALSPQRNNAATKKQFDILTVKRIATVFNSNGIQDRNE